MLTQPDERPIPSAATGAHSEHPSREPENRQADAVARIQRRRHAASGCLPLFNLRIGFFSAMVSSSLIGLSFFRRRRYRDSASWDFPIFRTCESICYILQEIPEQKRRAPDHGPHGLILHLALSTLCRTFLR